MSTLFFWKIRFIPATMNSNSLTLKFIIKDSPSFSPRTLSFRGEFAVVGLGMVVDPKPSYSARTMEAEAVRRAIVDAGLEAKDIDGAVELRTEGGVGPLTTFTDAFPRILGLPVKFYYSVSRGGSHSAMGIMFASKFLELGIANYVVLAMTKDEWTKSHRTSYRTSSIVEREGYWGRPLGDLRAVTHHSFFASRYMYEYGATHEQMGTVPVQTRAWACKNPLAKFSGRPITLDEYLKDTLCRLPIS